MNHARLVLILQNAFAEMAEHLAETHEMDEAKNFLPRIKQWLEQSKSLEQGMQTETPLSLFVQDGGKLAEEIANYFQWKNLMCNT